MKLSIFVDGGSRGNPGIAGAGVVVAEIDGGPVLEAGYYLGRATNNQAEYTALLRALDAARRAGATDLLIHSDSELLVRQLNGDYRVKSPSLIELFSQARAGLDGFPRWTVRHVPRERNARADALANLAMDAQEDVFEIDRLGVTDRPPAASSPATTDLPAIEFRCITPPTQAACPAPCGRNATFAFGATVPPGMCIHAAAAMIARVRSGRGDDDVSCANPSCQATFRVV